MTLISTLGSIFSYVRNFISDHMLLNRTQESKYLRSLLGDSPFFGRAEYEYISQVRDSIIKESRSRPNVSSSEHMKHKLSVMKDNFYEVVTYLKQNSRAKNDFVQNYPSWRSCRDLSILQLIYIAKTVNENIKDSAATRTVGSSVSLVGGLVCLIPGLGALRLAGGVLMGLGSLVAAGSSFIEFQLLQQKIKEAEKIILQDKDYSERLWNWISDFSHIQEANNIITSIDGNLKKCAKELHDCFKMEKTPEQKMMIITKVVNKIISPQWAADDISEVIGILLAIFMLHDRYRNLFNIASETYKCKRALRITDVTLATFKMASIINVGQSSQLNAFQKCTLGIGIALDVINIIQATKDFEETSKETIAIAEAAKKLKEEADIFKKLYDAVNRA